MGLGRALRDLCNRGVLSGLWSSGGVSCGACWGFYVGLVKQEWGDPMELRGLWVGYVELWSVLRGLWNGVGGDSVGLRGL